MNNGCVCCVPVNITPKLQCELPAYSGGTIDPKKFVQIKGGTFRMGANEGAHPEDGEGPIRDVTVSPFAITSTAITNGMFAEFISATAYQTVAERVGASFVFYHFVDDADVWPISSVAPWWRYVDGACWHRPYGGNLHAAGDHPVTHIAMADAQAYCQWSGTRLPTEAEWEYAARGGLDQMPYPWGDMLTPSAETMCNIWQGSFPTDTKGNNGTVAVHTHGSNGYGLFHMVGNVWEWTQDKFTHLHGSRPQRDPKGPLNGNQNVAKGGSYLCHHSYCFRYRNAARQGLDPHSTAGNVGFRVVCNTY